MSGAMPAGWRRRAFAAVQRTIRAGAVAAVSIRVVRGLAAAACGLGLLGIGAAQGRADAALPSALAARSLLLDVDRAGERLVAVGEWGHVVLSDDGGRSWRQAQQVPTRATLTSVDFVDARRGWAVGHDAVILHTSDAGERWEQQYADPEQEAPLLSVWFESAEHGFAVGAFGAMLETHDGGRSWSRRQIEAGSEEEHHLNEIFPGPEASIFIAAEFGSVFRSRDAGRSWELLKPPYEGSFWGGLALDGGAVLVFGMRGNVFRSGDLGESWQRVESGTGQSLQGAARISDGRLVLVGLGGVVLTSRDGGRSFSAAIEPERRGIAAVTEGAGDQLLLFGETGVKRQGEASG